MYARVVRSPAAAAAAAGEAASSSAVGSVAQEAVNRFRSGTGVVLRGRPDAMGKAKLAFAALLLEYHK